MDINQLMDYIHYHYETGSIVNFNEKKYKIVQMLGDGRAIGIELSNNKTISPIENMVLIELNKV